MNEGAGPGGIDVGRPSVARIYDYWLGGKDNFAADREAADQLTALEPSMPSQARSNRAFLGRAVHFLAEAGIRQFVDIGTGLPTQGNVHEVAREVTSQARVVYVDHDPVVLAHARALLGTSERTAVVQGDIRDPASILRHPDTRALIDFDEPVAVMLVAILHFVADEEDPAAIVATFRDAMAPGSYLVVSHGTADKDPSSTQEAAAVYRGAKSSVVPRPHAAVEHFFEGFELVEPGLVDVRAWRTDAGEDRDGAVLYAGVGRKP